MRQQGQYTLRFDGRSIIISLAAARERCPGEVAAMEAASQQVRAARVQGDQHANDAAEQTFEDRTRELARALGYLGSSR